MSAVTTDPSMQSAGHDVKFVHLDMKPARIARQRHLRPSGRSPGTTRPPRQHEVARLHFNPMSAPQSGSPSVVQPDRPPPQPMAYIEGCTPSRTRNTSFDRRALRYDGIG